MKLIIAGSRSIVDYGLLKKALRESGLVGVTEVVSGGAFGVDALGELWAAECNIPVRRFLPDWANNGKAAGPIRNREMAEYADACLLLWDGESVGSKSMWNAMRRTGKPLFEYVRRTKQ